MGSQWTVCTRPVDFSKSRVHFKVCRCDTGGWSATNHFYSLRFTFINPFHLQWLLRNTFFLLHILGVFILCKQLMFSITFLSASLMCSSLLRVSLESVHLQRHIFPKLSVFNTFAITRDNWLSSACAV